MHAARAARSRDIPEGDSTPLELDDLSRHHISISEIKPESATLFKEEVTQTTAERAKLIEGHQEKAKFYNHVVERLERKKKELLEKSDSKPLTAGDCFGMGVCSLIAGGGGGALIGMFSGMIMRAHPSFWNVGAPAIAGAVLLIPTWATVDILRVHRPWRADYREYAKVRDEIEKAVNEEKLTPELRIKLYEETIQQYQEIVGERKRQIQKLEEAERRYLAEEKGRLPDRFENARRKLGLSSGELIPSPREIKEQAEKLWKD